MVNYQLLLKQAREIINTDPYYVPAMSNLSALLMETLPELNWAGFYLKRDDMLVVGPFQGKPACIHIPAGKGVCGQAIAEDRMFNVPDVHQFSGHIACDSASNSEIVIPLHKNGKPAGVLDIDSILTDRFSTEDEEGLKAFAEMIEKHIKWPDT